MTPMLNIGDVLIVDQHYVDWHTKYHNKRCGVDLHNGQQTRPLSVGEKLHINHFWVAESYMIELCSEDGYIFRVSTRDAWRMIKAELVSRGAVFYGDAMMKPPVTIG